MLAINQTGISKPLFFHAANIFFCYGIVSNNHTTPALFVSCVALSQDFQCQVVKCDVKANIYSLVNRIKVMHHII